MNEWTGVCCSSCGAAAWHWADPPMLDPAIVGTHPKDGDVKQAPLVSGDDAEGNRTTPMGDGLGEQVERVLSPETRKWLRDNIEAAKRLMATSAKAGHGYDNFAAHLAFRCLTELAAIEATRPTSVEQERE